jgi:hypothetical protein
MKYVRGGLKVGISYMACHATVDPQTKMVIKGAPNSDLNAGLIMALATNSAAYFIHTDIENVREYIKIKDLNRTDTTSNGSSSPLPDPDCLE